jgi:hypothetical protein
MVETGARFHSEAVMAGGHFLGMTPLIFHTLCCTANILFAL